MRPIFNLRTASLGPAGAGALMLTIPAAAPALGAPQPTIALATPFPAGPIRVDVTPHELGYGRDVAVTGSVSSTDAGQQVGLSFAAAGGRSTWRTLATAFVMKRNAIPIARSGPG